uniref:Peptide/nickel transport system substrate-binding protein n=1 Tax=uncultured Chloroflexota bacterium TaxID=166587 RepID=H5S8P9_9CHLR|nr:peptide/nickel transport system substrate-binding protein [uncultured Chloroflexota bacterium]
MRRALVLLGLILLLLAACLPEPLPATDQGWTSGASSPPPAPSATATAAPRALTICLGAEPNTLYPLGRLNAAARSVLSALYDSPAERLNYTYTPIILEKIPTLQDGDARIERISVARGTEIVDAAGKVQPLAPGVSLLPAGCRAADCAITWDGQKPVNMERLRVTFKLARDIYWSDGAPVTAADSLFAYNLALAQKDAFHAYLLDRTASYKALDEQTIEWTGKPGFIDPSYVENFWLPLPEHAWKDFSPADLPSLDVVSRTPLGYGAYVVQDWRPGEAILLRKNPSYFRARQGLPRFETLTFRILKDANEAISALLSGECDLLDPTLPLEGQVGLLRSLEAQGKVRLWTAQSPVIEWLGLGLRPASYDDGYTPPQYDRPDFFGEVRFRQALALCLDRQKAVREVLFDTTQVADTLLPPNHPLHASQLVTYPYDPQAAAQLLESLGWRDHDQNPATPRRSYGVPNVPNNTELILRYDTTRALQRQQVAEVLAASLQACGIGLQVTFHPAQEFYAEGPQGLLFGRKFDLAEYAIGGTLEASCRNFMSDQVPNAQNQWIGANVGGFQNGEYDALCRKALYALPEEKTYQEAYQQLQQLFALQLPAIPLYARPILAVSRPDLCNLNLDPTASSPLWNLEAIDYGAGCP